MRVIGRVALAATAVTMGTASLAVHASMSKAAGTIRIGALYPLTGSQAGGGRQEFGGVRAAAALVNRSGGVNGKRIVFVKVDAPSADAAPYAVDSLKKDGVQVVMGSYGSTISLPATAQAQHDHLTYWESGAVATMITERGYPNVFRTVTTGNSLGRAAARYIATVVGPRIHMHPSQMRAAVVYANDVYGSSVGSSMAAETRSLGFKNAGVYRYDPYASYRKTFPALVSRLKAQRPDVVLVAGYVQDAVAFRRETLRQHLHPAAMIGTSSAFCMQAFGGTLGTQALGLFASDKPDADFSTRALRPAAVKLRAKAVAVYRHMFHASMTAPSLAGFVAGWILFHNVLPHARSLSPADVRAAALAVDLPYGSEVNGAGVKFAGSGVSDEGQNLRAISVIWQWQKPGKEYVVYPASYATSKPHFIPLPGWKR